MVQSSVLVADDLPVLTGVVRRVLGDDRAAIISWRAELVGTAIRSGFTAALERVRGTARTAAGERTWSVVLKWLRSPVTTGAYDDPRGGSYWRREACVYESGLLDGLPQGLAAPRCYGVTERAEGGVLLWLEEIPEAGAVRWEVGDLGRATRHLGRFNGWYLSGRPLPDAPWLARDPLAGWVEAQAEAAALLGQADLWEQPVMRRVFSMPVAGRLQRLWAEREHFLAALRKLPHTLCHFDAGHHNLVQRPGADGGVETVALDWEMTALAAVGEEAGLLVTTPLLLGTHGAEMVQQVQDAVFAGYLDGLRDAGCGLDARVVRLGFAANAALRHSFRLPSLRLLVDAARREREEQRLGLPLEDLLERRAALVYALLDLADEARALIAEE